MSAAPSGLNDESTQKLGHFLRLLKFVLLGLSCTLFVLPTPADDPVLIVKPEAFQTLVNPNCSHCIDESKRRSADLRPDDRVLCWTRGKYDGGAIPVRFFLNPYRVISDTYGTFVYDPDAGYARGFEASLDFQFHGWRNGIMVMKHKDGTLFSCLSGLAFDGPRKGERLKPWPTVVTDWGWWLANYKDTVAYHMYEKYKPTELPKTANADSVKSRGPADPRLPAEDLVLGVWDGKRAVAFPVQGMFDDPVNGGFRLNEDTLVLWYGLSKSASAFKARAEKRKPTDQLGVEGERIESRRIGGFEYEPKENPGAPFKDRETGSRFDVTGRFIDGPLKGWTLEPLDAVVCKWFAWAAEYPGAAIRR